jgi:hypothetical protein
MRTLPQGDNSIDQEITTYRKRWKGYVDRMSKDMAVDGMG